MTEGKVKKRDYSLGKKLKQLSILHEISKAMNSSLELRELLDLTLTKCLEVFDSQAGSIFLLDEGRNELLLQAAHGLEGVDIYSIKQRLGEGIAGFVASKGEPLLVTDIEKTPVIKEMNPRHYDHYKTKSFLCVPLLTTNRLVGVINITEKITGEPYTPDDLEFLATLASHASIAIEKVQLYERIKRFNKELQEQVRLATVKLKRSNEELLSLTEYNKSIVSSITDSIVVVDKDCMIMTWNPGMERQFSIRSDTACGKLLLDVLPSWREEGLFDPIVIALKKGKPAEMENVEHKLPSGAVQTFHAKFSPLCDSQSNITGVVIIITDITEKVDLEKQLLLSEKLASIGKLAAGVAHELNNPLDGVIRYTNLLLDATDEKDVTREYLLGAKEGLNRMAKIIESLLTFSRQTTPTLEPTDINKTVEDSLLLLNMHALSRNVKIIKKLNKSLPFIMDGELQQVFTNLLRNAYDAVSEGGEIVISTDMNDQLIQIKISDNGPGIPRDIQDKIFDPFFTTKEVGKGTGLGLAICYGIIEKYNGTIVVDSQLGKGATFTINLPRKYIKEKIR